MIIVWWLIVFASNLKHLGEFERLLHGLKTDLEFLLYWTEIEQLWTEADFIPLMNQEILFTALVVIKAPT